ncbi:MAG: type II toxin-antitoxin system prevent-host-death family antitoxin [Deltaproteobacteria bacterium]|nr:type II toxin-antitoxin system prevent-host-death family antitoxin [Deltaproteobacteria bacterium]
MDNNELTTHTYKIQDVIDKFPQLIKDVESGQDVIISREGKPLARISPVKSCEFKIQFGVLKGKIKVSEDFDAPLPDEVLSGFEGN